MALVKCKQCGATISERATRCPKCGSTEPHTLRPSCHECGVVLAIDHAADCPECGNPAVSEVSSQQAAVVAEKPKAVSKPQATSRVATTDKEAVKGALVDIENDKEKERSHREFLANEKATLLGICLGICGSLYGCYGWLFRDGGGGS